VVLGDARAMSKGASRDGWWCYHLHEACRVAEGTWGLDGRPPEDLVSVPCAY
jgi:hypothetical protein